MQFRKDKETYIIRFEKGEEIISGLKKFCQDLKITGAHFTMIGGCEKVELAFYNLAEKKYQSQTFNQPLEAVSVVGNIAINEEDEIMIHTHGVFSDENYQTKGGHIMQMTVHATAEIFLTKLNQTLKRKLDPHTGLKILS